MAEVVEDNATLEAEDQTSAESEATLEDSNQDNNQDGSQDAAPEMSAEAIENAEATPAVASPPARDAEGFTSALPSAAPEATSRQHVPGGVGYEIIYVVRAGDPALVESSSQHVRDLIERGEGAVDNIRASEVRRFAYPIKKQTEGVYVVVNARFKPEFTGELDRYFKIDENILRHMMLKEDR